MDIYQTVTDRIISIIERGTIPWRKNWSAGSGIPKNLVSKKEYRGVNIFLLSASQYSSPYWLTFAQAKSKNGTVLKGEKSSLVIFWKLPLKQGTGGTEETEAVTPVTSVTPEKQFNRSAPILRYYNLFNLEQCDGISAPTDPEETVNPFSPIEKCEQIIAGYKNRPDIHYGGNRAFYRASEDRVQMPHEHTFNTSEDFYQVLLHELSHSTGHKSRLARKEVVERNEFGADDYSSEEICADLSASMLCAVAGISNQTIEMSASYINGWLSVLRSDKKAIVVAAARAQASADHILGKTFTEEEPA